MMAMETKEFYSKRIPIFMPNKNSIPVGKAQFGILIPTRVHDKARLMATLRNKRISDVYAEGIIALTESEEAGRGPDEMRLLKSITRDVDKQDWVLYKAIAGFLRDKPANDKLEMLRLILGKHLPVDAEIGFTAAKK